MPSSSEQEFRERVYGLVRAIPPGRVTTYGALARALGAAVSPREVGRAIAQLRAGHDVPAHRVVSAAGTLLCPRGRGAGRDQRTALAREGVQLDSRGRVSLDAFLWDPAQG